MTAIAIGEEFAVGRCAYCERDVLAVPDLDPEEIWRCAHCDERLREVRTVGERALDALGYELSSGEEPASSGCTSCGSDGCGVPPRGSD